MPPTNDADNQACDEVVRTLAAQRAQVQNFVAAHQRRLRQAEAELAKQLALIGEELARDHHRTAQEQSQAARSQSEVAQGRAELEREREQFETALARLRQEERELDQLRQEHAANVEELA
ncbi:MAG TPA: hypothetical protein VND64_06900, partial [Pirellulales bacterium]|nr:hypothetical protein [Pirellulales bacterium]